VLEYALSLARDLAHSWPRGPHQYYLCATPPSIDQGHADATARGWLRAQKIFKADVDKEHEHREFSGKPMGGFDYGSSWRMLVKK